MTKICENENREKYENKISLKPIDKMKTGEKMKNFKGRKMKNLFSIKRYFYDVSS